LNSEKNAQIELIITSSHRIHDTIGGVEKFVASFSSWCIAKGIDVTIVSRVLSLKSIRITQNPVYSETNDRLKTVKKIQLSPQLYYLGLAVFSISAFFTLMRIIKRLRLHGSKLLVIHSQDTNFAALATVFAGKLLNVHTVIHQHGPYQELLSSKNMKMIEQNINKVTCRFSNLVIATDIYTAEYLKKLVSDKTRIRVIPAAVNINLYDIPEKEGFFNKSYFTIGYIGRLSTEKNLELLLRAFKEFKLVANVPCKLVLVGDGKLRLSLKQLATTLKINGDIVFTGFQKNILPFLSSFDVFVLPSKIEGTPISLIEAMAAGKAIIASKIPPIEAIVADEKEALLFNPDNSAELKDKLLAFFDDSELCKKLGSNARNKSKEYDAEIIFGQILKEYAKLRPIRIHENREDFISMFSEKVKINVDIS